MVVFFVSGFWHGAGWGYILFGVNWGIAQVIDIFIEKWWKKVPGALQWLCTFAFTVMNVAFFRAATVGDAMAIFQRIGALDFGPIAQEIYEGFRPMEVEFVQMCIRDSMSSIARRFSRAWLGELFWTYFWLDFVLVVLSLACLVYTQEKAVFAQDWGPGIERSLQVDSALRGWDWLMSAVLSFRGPDGVWHDIVLKDLSLIHI